MAESSSGSGGPRRRVEVHFQDGLGGARDHHVYEGNVDVAWLVGGGVLRVRQWGRPESSTDYPAAHIERVEIVVAAGASGVDAASDAEAGKGGGTPPIGFDQGPMTPIDVEPLPAAEAATCGGSRGPV